jgi:hypothetical protein
MVALFGSSTTDADTSQLQDYPIPNGHFYTQANGQGGGGSYGYRIVDDDKAKFWSEFQRLGGVDILGYPNSRRFILDGFLVQGTQRVIMQWRPEVQQVYFVNVFDKAHDLGKDDYLFAAKQIPRQLDPSFDAGLADFNAITAKRLALLDDDLTISGKYWSGRTRAEVLVLNGLPTSKVTDMGPALVIRAERKAFQKWKQDMPFAKAGTVTEVLGGDIAKDPQIGIIPADAQITETAAGNLSATPTPIATPTPTATPKPQFPYRSKDVTSPPQDCGSGNRVPCQSSAPNLGAQYIQGHVIDQSGNGIGGITVRTAFYGKYVDNSTEGDGLFTFNISSTCPKQAEVFSIFIVDGSGNQASDTRTVSYSDCASAGEFHFDFVKVG